MPDTKKAYEDDVVELVEDLPEYGFKRGQRGVVIEAFEKPSEGYDLEFEDEAGNFLGLAYAIKPHQIVNVSREAFEQGVEFFSREKYLEAARAFQQAIDLKPGYIDVLNNIIIRSFGTPDDLGRCIDAFRFLSQLNPQYEDARNNLAVAYLQYGIRKEQEGDVEEALRHFRHALLVAKAETVVDSIKRSFAATYTSLGMQEYHNRNYDRSLEHISAAFDAYPDETTRQNLGRAYANAAESYLGRGNFQKAVRFFEQAQIAGDMDPELLNDHGIALAKLGRVDEAIQEFKKGLELNPEDETIQSNLSLVKSATNAEYRRLNVEAGFDPVPQVQLQEFAPAA